MARYDNVAEDWEFTDDQWLRICSVCKKPYEWKVHDYKKGHHHNRCPKHREQFVQRQEFLKKKKKYRVLLPRFLR
mgnify:CR=1 FL=1